MINKWVVRIPLECILVLKYLHIKSYVFTRVCHSVHRGGVPGQVPPTPPQAGTPPRQVHPRQVHPWAGTLPRQVHPPPVHPLCRYNPSGRYTPRQGHPPWPQCILGYDQQVGGTHPTGVHSCFEISSH